ncbi:MAG: hypothetical protein AMXMBFR47_27690 [Planctomycetota bacterium]
MLDRRIIELTREIRELYARNCALADKLNRSIVADQESVRRACRGRESPIPELNRFPDVFARSDAMHKALKDPTVSMHNGLFQFACWVTIAMVTWQVLAIPNGMVVALAIVPILAGIAFLFHQRFILGGGVFRRRLREQLVASGVPLCLECGYDLRGQLEPRCPECGRAAPRPQPAPAKGEACHVR